jgi:short-subunit dehydrogenase
MAKRIVLFGATSALAVAFARAFIAREETALLLAGRDVDRLAATAEDLRVRGAAHVETLVTPGPAADYARVVRAALDRFAPIDVVLVAQGLLPDQRRLDAADLGLLAQTLDANVESMMRASLVAAQALEAQRGGALVVVGSVAGDRSRRANYVYGAAKAAIAAFADGLRLRLCAVGVHVLLVKPGPFRSPMTAGLTPTPLWSEPGAVAEAIVKALARRRRTVYAPAIWRAGALVLRALPDAMLRRLTI